MSVEEPTSVQSAIRPDPPAQTGITSNLKQGVAQSRGTMIVFGILFAVAIAVSWLVFKTKHNQTEAEVANGPQSNLDLSVDLQNHKPGAAPVNKDVAIQNQKDETQAEQTAKTSGSSYIAPPPILDTSAQAPAQPSGQLSAPTVTAPSQRLPGSIGAPQPQGGYTDNALTLSPPGTTPNSGPALGSAPTLNQTYGQPASGDNGDQSNQNGSAPTGDAARIAAQQATYEKILAGVDAAHQQAATGTISQLTIASTTAVSPQAARVAAAAPAATNHDQIPPGTKWHAVLDDKIDSYVASIPVTAHLTSGPYNGAKLMGTFTTSNSDYLVIRFDKIIIGTNTYKIDLLAVDPGTGGGVPADVDHHYAARIILPITAAALGLFGASQTFTGGTTTTGTTGTTQQQNPLSSGQKLTYAVSTGVSQGITPVITAETSKIQDQSTKPRGTPIDVELLSPVTVQ